MLFKAKIEEYRIVDDKVIGVVGWADEEDKQTFIWKNTSNYSQSADAKLLCDYLNDANLVNGDVIIITEEKLLLKLKAEGWSSTVANNALRVLLSIKVKMLDDGEETDSFFLHF